MFVPDLRLIFAMLVSAVCLVFCWNLIVTPISRNSLTKLILLGDVTFLVSR